MSSSLFEQIGEHDREMQPTDRPARKRSKRQRHKVSDDRRERRARDADEE